MVSPLAQTRIKTDKEQVHDFWNEASCGESLYLQGLDRDGYEAQARKRHDLESYILEFADFDNAQGKRVLEIGVGLGADHQRFAQAGTELYGIDLTARAVEHTGQRLGFHPGWRWVTQNSLITLTNILTGFTLGVFYTIVQIRPRRYRKCGGC